MPAFSRRRFLRLLGQGTLAASLPGALWAGEPDVVTVSIFHTTDLHGHILPTVGYDGRPDVGGLARCAAQIRQWRNSSANSLLLDLGDVYQGTELGLQARGATMIRCLNALNYDAWVVGNHDLDWGLDTFSACVEHSTMPVLSGNGMVGGTAIGQLSNDAGPLAKLHPFLIREIAGIRLAIVSVTTPALSSWLPPEVLGNFEVLDPVEALRDRLREVAALHPDAILLAGHMGLTRCDDDANRVGELTRTFPQLVVCIGGHTHQNHSGATVNGVLYTQANYFGLHAGRVDLTFDRASRRLLRRQAITIPMDAAFPLDPFVLSIAHADLDAADLALGQKMGDLLEPLSAVSAPGRPSDVERLIGSAMKAILQVKGCDVDAVVHGLFKGVGAVPAGTKTVADAWTILPYENEIVTVDLARADLLAIAQELSTGRDTRSVMGLQLVFGGPEGQQVVDIRSADGTPLPGKPNYRVALNSFDSQSAGERFPLVGRLVAQSGSRRTFHPVQVRAALIDFFASRGKVGRASLLV